MRSRRFRAAVTAHRKALGALFRGGGYPRDVLRAVSRSLARRLRIRDFRPESRLFRSAPRTCHGVGGRLRMRWTDCEGGSPRVRYTTARFRHPAWLRHGRDMAARGASAIGSTRYWLSE